jgi:hypothetical protein
MRFSCMNMQAFSLLLKQSSFFQNVKKFDSIASSSKKRNFAQSLFVRKLSFNRILLVVITPSDQNFLRATLNSLMDDWGNRIVHRK